MIAQDDKLSTAVFGRGSVMMTIFRSVARKIVLLEPVDSGQLETEAETSRSGPKWSVQGVSLEDMPQDGQARIALQFDSRDGLQQLILALQELEAEYDRTAVAF